MFGNVGVIGADVMRRIRIKEFYQKAQAHLDKNPDLAKKTVNTIECEKNQLDEARFIQKYLDSVSSKQYQAYFCNYNENMFAQLMLFCKYTELEKEQFLFKAGDIGKYFYFVVQGNLDILVKSSTSDDFKYSKGADESTFFGMKKSFNEPRVEYAKVKSDKCQVIEIDTQIYNEIVAKTQLSEGEKKVEFLFRHVPKFRKLPRNMIEDFEVYFQKEQCTKGFTLQKIDDQGDYLYFIYRGICKVIFPVSKLPEIFYESAIFDATKQQYFVLGHFKEGQMFGEQSSLNNLPNPYTIIAASSKVEYYKIHRSTLQSYFGGQNGETINQMRAKIILQNNWLCSKIIQLESYNVDQLWKLEYCNDEDINSLKSTMKIVKEIPYIRNNPRYQKGEDGKKNEKEGEGKEVGVEKTEKQKRIEALKKQLLAPVPKRQVAAQGIRKPENDPMDNKFKRVMDWGTPRLVTKNRQLQLDPKQEQSRSFLMGIAGMRKGGPQVPQGKKPDFAKSSIANFRARMLEEEKDSEMSSMPKKDFTIKRKEDPNYIEAQNDDNEELQNGISYGVLPQPQFKMDRSQSLAIGAINTDQAAELRALFNNNNLNSFNLKKHPSQQKK